MTQRNQVRRLASPLKVLAIKAANRIASNIRGLQLRIRDRRLPSYAMLKDPGGLASYLLAPIPVAEDLEHLCEKYLEHHFDLLGSGWVQIRHGMECGGLEGHRYPPAPAIQCDSAGNWLKGRINHANLAAAQRIWRLVDDGYMPIDWQLDFKSGFRWSEAQWHRDIRYGDQPGADVKLPWELARMQHLPLLAMAYCRAAPKGVTTAQRYWREIRNEILDFIATNPPRFGANWSCTMDVAIRAANWLLALDLVRAGGEALDDTFESVLLGSLYDHGRFIIEHLEWRPELRGNHYLADIVGLLFIAAYLPMTPETKTWLAFGVQELIKEVDYQFHADGSNFEASTSYHRLSAEMVVYATALILGLPAERRQALQNYDYRLHRVRPALRPAPLVVKDSPFPECYLHRLERMAEFMMAVTKPSNRIVQIGDTDNGRLFKLHPIGATVGGSWREEHLDHRPTIAAINALFERVDLSSFAGTGWADEQVVRALSKGTGLQPRGLKPLDTGNALQARAFPDFGLFVYRSEQLFVAIRCGAIGQYGHGGHAHCDQLSFELSLRGQDCLMDSGTYVYTPLPQRRDELRGTAAHNTLRIDGVDQAPILPEHPFFLPRDPQGRCLEWAPDRFSGEHLGYERLKSPVRHRRSIDIDNPSGGLTLVDELEGTGERDVEWFFHLPPVPVEIQGYEVLVGTGEQRVVIAQIDGDALEPFLEQAYLSPAYGVCYTAPVLVFRGKPALPMKVKFQVRILEVAIV